jgi:hypothetical protein
MQEFWANSFLWEEESKATVDPNNQNGGTSALELALAWGFVGLPLLWGIYGTLVNAMKLFQ